MTDGAIIIERAITIAVTELVLASFPSAAEQRLALNLAWSNARPPIAQSSIAYSTMANTQVLYPHQSNVRRLECSPFSGAIIEKYYAPPIGVRRHPGTQMSREARTANEILVSTLNSQPTRSAK